MTTTIDKKIVQFSLVKPGETEHQKVVKEDVNPLTKRIEKRPEGEFNSVTSKVIYRNHTGKKTAYLTVSFMPSMGVLNGKDIVVDRPIEFFFHNGEDQWIKSAMRGLSLATRGGFLVEFLQDMRKVTWDKGLVSCGTKLYGDVERPIRHESEVAAIAWAIQDILYKKGLLDIDGNQIPLEVLMRKQENKPIDLDSELPIENNVVGIKPETPQEMEEASLEIKGAKCPSCHEFAMIKTDGCDKCQICGESKCG